MQETKTQREKRKNMYISYVLAHARGMGNSKMLIREATIRWEKGNKNQKDE
jgi:hypothetical protein